jgi:hypothetical protein
MNMARNSLLARLAAMVLLASLAACGVVGITPPPTTSSPSPTATLLPPTPGTPFEVQGVLEAEGNLPGIRFFLRSEDGTRIEVMAWLPVEVIQSPTSQSAPPTMADWVGHKVELHGQWVQTETGLAFQVISAERKDS